MTLTAILLVLFASAPVEPPSAKTLQPLPVCAPPSAGTWWVVQDCVVVGRHVAPGPVVVWNGVTLRLLAGADLDVDFTHHFLRIRQDARVIVGDGARIR